MYDQADFFRVVLDFSCGGGGGVLYTTRWGRSIRKYQARDLFIMNVCVIVFYLFVKTEDQKYLQFISDVTNDVLARGICFNR